MYRRTLLFVSVFLLCVGCSSSFKVAVSGRSGMNNGGNAAIVKVYQLKGEGNFKNTPLSAFWRGDTEALGGELIGSPRKMTVYPSTKRTIEFTVAKKAKFVGVAANLRDPDREKWRSIHSLKDMGNELTVTVVEDRVIVKAEEKSLFDKMRDWF